MNISATGALVRTDAFLPEGHECPLLLKARDSLAHLKARIVWTKPLPIGGAASRSDEEEYLVAVRFTDLPWPAKQAVSALCGPDSTWKE